MTNLPKTHRLVVTLPNTCGEEADALATILENIVTHKALGSDPDTGATVEHAGGAALLAGYWPGIVARLTPGRNILCRIDTGRARPQLITPAEARQLAGALLILADESEEV